jgi:hypothetical protein
LHDDAAGGLHLHLPHANRFVPAPAAHSALLLERTRVPCAYRRAVRAGGRGQVAFRRDGAVRHQDLARAWTDMGWE